jgi:hypothetical protein
VPADPDADDAEADADADADAPAAPTRGGSVKKMASVFGSAGGNAAGLFAVQCASCRGELCLGSDLHRLEGENLGSSFVVSRSVALQASTAPEMAQTPTDLAGQGVTLLGSLRCGACGAAAGSIIRLKARQYGRKKSVEAEEGAGGEGGGGAGADDDDGMYLVLKATSCILLDKRDSSETTLKQWKQTPWPILELQV